MLAVSSIIICTIFISYIFMYGYACYPMHRFTSNPSPVCDYDDHLAPRRSQHLTHPNRNHTKNATTNDKRRWRMTAKWVVLSHVKESNEWPVIWRLISNVARDTPKNTP